MPQADRKAVKAALRAAGLSARQVHALLAQGWRGVVDSRDAESQELREQLDALQARLGIAPEDERA